jgi:hypothetical protein
MIGREDQKKNNLGWGCRGPPRLVEKLTFFHLIYIFLKNYTLEIPSAVLKNAQIQELLGVLLPYIISSHQDIT